MPPTKLEVLTERVLQWSTNHNLFWDEWRTHDKCLTNDRLVDLSIAVTDLETGLRCLQTCDIDTCDLIQFLIAVDTLYKLDIQRCYRIPPKADAENKTQFEKARHEMRVAIVWMKKHYDICRFLVKARSAKSFVDFVRTSLTHIQNLLALRKR